MSFFAPGLQAYSQAYFFVEYEDLAGTTLDDFVLCLVAQRPFDFPSGIADGHPLVVVANDNGPGGQDEILPVGDYSGQPWQFCGLRHEPIRQRQCEGR